MYPMYPAVCVSPLATDCVLYSCMHVSKHGQKRTQTLLNCILSINNGNRTSHGAPWRHHGPFLAFLGHFWPQNFSKCPSGQNTSKLPIPAGGGPTEKKVVPEKVAEKHPGCRGPIFFRFWDPLGSAVQKGPCWLPGPSCCLLACCCLLLQVQAPRRDTNNWINRLKYYVLQLGDPNPNQKLVIGPS